MDSNVTTYRVGGPDGDWVMRALTLSMGYMIDQFTA